MSPSEECYHRAPYQLANGTWYCPDCNKVAPSPGGPFVEGIEVDK